MLKYVSGYQGSAGVKDPAAGSRYRAMLGRADNERYYGQKWGGPVLKEVYKTPFGVAGGWVGAWVADERRIACIRGEKEFPPGPGGQCGPYNVTLMTANPPGPKP